VWNGKWADFFKVDASLKSFLFMLKPPHNVPKIGKNG
jgi:hypothetical protein